MKVLASPAFAMQPPTRPMAAATPARATATPPTPASSARSGLVFKPVTTPRILEQGYQRALVSVPSNVENAITGIMGTIGKRDSLEEAILDMIPQLLRSQVHHILYDEKTGVIRYFQCLETAQTVSTLFEASSPNKEAITALKGLLKEATATPV